MKYQVTSAIEKVFSGSVSSSLFYSAARQSKPPRVLLKQRAIPHYVRLESRKQVLSTFRKLFRAGGYRQIDPLCRLFLAQFIAESFKSNKYISDASKIQSLLLQAQESLEILNRASYRNSPQILASNVKDIDHVLNFCFSRIFVTKGPITTRLLTLSNRHHFKDYPTVTNTVTQQNVIRRICTLQTPPKHLISTLAEYNAFQDSAAALANSSSSSSKSGSLDNSKNNSPKVSEIPATKRELIPPLYFRFIHALKSNTVSHYLYSRTESTISFVPLLEGTMTGAPLPRVRETNLLRAQIRKILHSLRMPLDTRVFAYLDEALSSSLDDSQQKAFKSKHEALRAQVLLPQGKSIRFYLRRLLAYFEKSYTCTCDEIGNINIITPRNYRIKTSTRLTPSSSTL